MRAFDLVYMDASAEPLEVTRATLGPLRAAQSAREKHVGYVRGLVALTRSWHVMTSAHARFRDWTDGALREFLSELEDAHLDEFFVERRGMSGSFSRQRASALGITAAFGSDGTPGRVLVSPPGGERGWVSNHSDPGAHALSVLEQLASSPDNMDRVVQRDHAVRRQRGEHRRLAGGGATHAESPQGE